MFKKVIDLFDSGKLANYAWFFGSMTLTLAAITGMAWAYCGLDSKKQKYRESGEDPDVLSGETESDQ